MPQIEICVFSPESCLNAQNGGANRVELCGGMYEGGTTPSYGLMQWARKHLSIELFVMIRPRGGDFCYDEWEFETMKNDIEIAKRIGCDGVVFGILLPDGNIDIERNRELVNLAKPLKTTIHRAFDMAADPLVALEDIIKIGAVRILTSGQKNTAIEGIELLEKLVKQAAGRIEIMAGAGVNVENAVDLLKTGIDALHLSAKSLKSGAMVYRKNDVSMTSVFPASEYEIIYSDTQKISDICLQF